ncbi:MAG: hypothetical protein KJ072_07595 [Verrucomicrobia bacterium]|nr:hypothetical protein [Verrucomicrobiota bacterium]
MRIEPQPPRERGSATLVVLVLLFLMAALALGNNRTLRQLHQELNLIEQRQLRNLDTAHKPQAIDPITIPAPTNPPAPR